MFRGEGEGSGDLGLAGLAGRVGGLVDGSAGWPAAVFSSLVGSGTLDPPEAVSAAANPPAIRLQASSMLTTMARWLCVFAC